MLVLDAMTSHLGELDSWPTYIFQFLFIDHPPPVRPKKVKRVMAFFMETMFPSNWPIVLQCLQRDPTQICSGTVSRMVS